MAALGNNSKKVITRAGQPAHKNESDMTKDKIISAMKRFTPPIVGECPKCGEPIFSGWCCFGCGYSGEKVKQIDWENLK